ncbi:unnamed protein product [Prorocentrum cordatum]|uniref:RING-type domain-containing protein n=1 Tax=Prorocentrum cordatum TaxID=2364126 RepID=A0ABN9S5B4_9DINO|nr:unnamed protein product [Polarella glacialis]
MGYGSPKTLIRGRRTSGSPFIAQDNQEGSDLLALLPTFMLAVPAILDLIKTGLEMKLKAMEGFKGQLVRTAVRHAQGHHGEESVIASMLSGIGLQGPVLNGVKAKLGLQKMRIIGSGGAPLSAETHHYISNVLAPVAQGYGCTETTGAMTIQEVVSSDGRPQDLSAGRVGPVQPSAEIKLLSCAEMGYLVTDDPPRGELLLSGHNVTQLGYYKMKEKTDEDLPIHADGQRWFHSGDIGCMMENGTVKIIDRKKDLIKLSGGEYVALGKVEAALKQVTGIGAAVVFASPDKDHCVCIVSQPEKGWKSVGGKPVEAELVKAIGESLRTQKLAKFEIPTKVKVDEEIWTPDNGLVTASMKLQRNPLRKHYNEPGGLLDQMGYRPVGDEVLRSDALVVSFHCGHSFHDSCIRQWFTRRHTCPTCRFGFEVDDVRYLRSIGLTDEAEVLDKAQKEKQAVENAKQVAARRRWVESMRRGDPVHFGLSCGRCGISPLIGDCYRCCTCDGFVLCSDCHVEHQALRRAGGPSSGAVAGASGGEEHPLGHVFAPFGAGVLAGGAGERGVPPGRGGLLTVLVPAPAYGGQSFEDGAAEDDDYEEAPVAGEASVAAAEVAFAAVRSLALAPLAGSPIGSVVGGLSPRTLRRRAQRGR